jgi:hypothetical protein
MDPAEATDLKLGLQKEYDSIPHSESYLSTLKEEGKPIPLKVRVKLFTENIYVRVGLAIAYLWLVRLVRDLKNPRPENLDEQEDPDSF